MDKRDLAREFRERLRSLIGTDRGSVGAFLRETGIDRSALSQFLDPETDRLPRAETLRRIAEARGVTTDWLLSLTNTPVGSQQVAPLVEIEAAGGNGDGSPIGRWRREAAGMKLRYVPAGLPDMLWLAATPARGETASAPADNPLEGFQPGDMDVEIAMPLQAVEDLAFGCGSWRGTDPGVRHRQLAHMAGACAEAYPVLRLHLFDGRETFSAPFTVFGRMRAALYLGEGYLVVTSAEQVASLSRLFDGLVRRATIGPDRVHETLAELADQVH